MNKPSTTNRSRLTLLMIVAFFGLPVVAAWILNFGADFTPPATANHGALIQPVQPITAEGYTDTQGVALAADFFLGEWTLVYRLSGGCTEACLQSLYKMRQVRLSQGKNIDRIKRLLIVDSTASGDWLAEVQTHYPGLVLVRSTAGTAQFQAGDHIFLVDPLGNLMMDYAPEVEPRGLIKDLERLLRISYVG